LGSQSWAQTHQHDAIGDINEASRRQANVCCRFAFGQVIEPKEAQGMHRLPLMHGAPTLGTTTARAGGTAEGRGVRRIDDVYDDAARLERIRIDGHRIIGVHAYRRGVDNDLAPPRIGWAKTRCATGLGADGLGEVVGAMLVDIEYGKCPGARGRDRKCDSATCASGADEKNRFVRRVITLPLHS
jgi:hypothetical protein